MSAAVFDVSGSLPAGGSDVDVGLGSGVDVGLGSGVDVGLGSGIDVGLDSRSGVHAGRLHTVVTVTVKI